MQISKFQMNNKSQRGNTVIELLIYMGIFTILLVVLLNMFTSVMEKQLASEATSSVQEDGQYILTRLTYDIQRAQTITTPNNPGSSSNQLQLTIGGTTYSYATASGNLQITSGTTDVLNGYDTTVPSISFKKIGNVNGKPSINLNYTLTSKVIGHAQNPETQTFSTTVETR